MKYSVNSSGDNALYCEQFQQMTNVFEQWNDCERTVFLYALLKHLPPANLKFLLHAIENHMKQASGVQSLSIIEEAANAVSFLNKVMYKYGTLVNFTSSTDTIDTCHSSNEDQFSTTDSIKSLENDLVMKYASKEELVQDLLMYLPLLRPNNDEGKKVYFQLLPMLIEDATKHNIPVELVQQILSYLLIHPVVKSEDRKNLHQWLQKLQDHMVSGYQSSTSSSGVSGMGIFLSSDTASSFMSNASSISSASSSSSASSATWPTAVPQIQTNTSDVLGNNKKKICDQEFWDLRNFQVSTDFYDDLNPSKYQPAPIGQGPQNNAANLASQSGAEELHISFSKNGTEVDFESDFLDAANAANGSKAVHAPSTTTSSQDFLTVPNFSLYDNIYGFGGFSTGTGSDAGFSDDGNAIKTRRSNSLTTPNSGTAGSDFAMSSSAENLANLQKPRSFSLSMESSRKAMTSAGSETRLDDWNKIAQMRFGTHPCPAGMANIAVWLKSLRLHKYFWLFTNVTYEQMMEMTEEYLENLGVTKGARHKLVLCIQKLADRVPLLKQLSKELSEGGCPLKTALDELTNIVMTPMKDINSIPMEEDVAAHVMLLLDIAFKVLQNVKFLNNQDEESVNVFMWVLDKTIHHEAFNSQVGHLRDYRYKLQRIKNMFLNKSFGNSGSNCSIGKSTNPNMKRWTPKPKGIVQGNSNQSINSMSDNQKLRKNSIPYYNAPQYNAKNVPYQNFNGQPQSAQMLSNFQRSSSRENLNQFTLMQQQHQMQYTSMPPPQAPQSNSTTNPAIYGHRNSLNNLMPFPSQQQFVNRRNSSCGTDRMMQQHAEKASLGETLSAGTTTTTNSDINSRLESLCRQMTEQAIN